MRKLLIALMAIAIVVLIPLISLELILRAAFGFPHGSFNFLLSAKDGLYPRNALIVMDYGFKPYTVKTNSFGMRGGQIKLHKTPGVKRIFTLGDSVTDGYFVDNDQTYPHYLGELLNERGYRAEVACVAKGGGSIDKELALLKVVLPLKPDIVVLTFVTNDIWELRDKSRADILNMKLRSARGIVPEWLLTHTAIGELIGDLKLKMKYKTYRLSSRQGKFSIDESLGAKYDENARKYTDTTIGENPIMRDKFSADTEKIVENYFAALERMNDLCQENGAKLMLVYFPCYSQVYDMSVPLTMRDALKDECSKQNIAFLDLTQPFRSRGRSDVLHFAPYDFHCNARGNMLMASEIAAFIEKNFKR